MRRTIRRGMGRGRRWMRRHFRARDIAQPSSRLEMKRFTLLLRIVGAAAPCLALTGCFIRLPSSGTPEMRKRIGYTVPVKKQMFVHAAFDGNIAIAKSSRAAAVTRKIGTLEP